MGEAVLEDGACDFTVIENDGHKAMHMKSVDSASRISKVIKDIVNLKETPILGWKWHVPEREKK
jgi:hypothetical protein